MTIEDSVLTVSSDASLNEALAESGFVADDEPTAEDIAAVMEGLDAPSVVVQPPEPDRVPCPHCGGVGLVDAAPPGAAVIRVIGRHALDDAPHNSKIVVTNVGAILCTPDGHTQLPGGDPANTLPNGARIFKTIVDGEPRYTSRQLDATEDHPDFVTTTAGDAIARFVEHFHPSGLHS